VQCHYGYLLPIALCLLHNPCADCVPVRNDLRRLLPSADLLLTFVDHLDILCADCVPGLLASYMLLANGRLNEKAGHPCRPFFRSALGSLGLHGMPLESTGDHQRCIGAHLVTSFAYPYPYPRSGCAAHPPRVASECPWDSYCWSNPSRSPSP
jgi:hypothetical protein